MAAVTTNLQSEKRAAEYVIYSTALLLWLYIPGIFTGSVANCPEILAPWLLLECSQSCLSSSQDAFCAVYPLHTPVLELGVLSSSSCVQDRCNGVIRCHGHIFDKILQSSGKKKAHIKLPYSISDMSQYVI